MRREVQKLRAGGAPFAAEACPSSPDLQREPMYIKPLGNHCLLASPLLLTGVNNNPCKGGTEDEEEDRYGYPDGSHCRGDDSPDDRNCRFGGKRRRKGTKSPDPYKNPFLGQGPDKEPGSPARRVLS